jgi:multidrug efflux pump subunit AcrB
MPDQTNKARYALHESRALRFCTLLGMPIANIGAFVTACVRGTENNFRGQIGLAMLIGIALREDTQDQLCAQATNSLR